MSSVTYTGDNSSAIQGGAQVGGGTGASRAGKAAVTGAGNYAGGDVVLPDVAQQAQSPGGLVALTLQALLGSVGEKLSKVFSNEDTSILVQEVVATIEEAVKGVLENDIKSKTANKLADIQENARKMKEAADAQAAANAKRKKSSFWSKLVKFFVAAVTSIVGAVLIATAPATGGAGAVVGAALVTMGVLMLTDAAVEAATKKGIGAHIAKALGVDEMWGDLIFTAMMLAPSLAMGPAAIGVAVTVFSMMLANAIVKETTGATIGAHIAKSLGVDEMWGEMIFAGIMLAASVAGGKAGSSIADASKAANAASTGAKAADTGAKAAETAIKAAELSSKGTYAMAGMQLLSTGAKVGAEIVNYQASDAEAKAARKQAEQVDFQALMQLLDKFTELTIDSLKNAGDMIARILEDYMSSMEDRSAVLTRAKLTA